MKRTGENIKRTITQAAKELNVSRKKIYNEIEKLKIQTEKEGKNNYISNDDFKLIEERIEEQTEEYIDNTQERTKNVLERDRSMIGGTLTDREYVDLKERISFLEEQINTKDEQIKVKDYQLNGLLQSTFNLSKALNPSPSDEVAVTKDETKVSWISKLFKRKI